MSDQGSYWTKRMLSRRAALRGALAAGGGLAALSLIGCGGDDDDDSGGAAKPITTGGGTLDPTKGVQGGRMIAQQYGDPGGGLELVKVRNAGVHQMAGFTHDGLLEFRNGTPAFDGYDIQPQPNLAQAMPEQPADGLTYIFKLRPAKFHNGRTVTSEDVKYSLERYATGSDSAWKSDFATWFERVDTPDPQTAVVKTKILYADSLQSLTARNSAEILAKEHEESPEHEKKLMGTGPYTFVSYEPPVVGSKYKRNPEYHRQPYPYFDEVNFLGTADTEKKIADFASKQVHMTYYFPPEERERIKKLRPDALFWSYLTGFSHVWFRTDQAPYSDKRVRQALSMAIDRKAFSQAITNGDGEPDQFLSIAGKYWGFRKPSELPAAKNWNFDVATAKSMLSAAGATIPIKGEMPHWNATVIGPKYVDAAVLIGSMWRNAGVADMKDSEQTFGQSTSTIQVGNYDGVWFFPNTTGYDPEMGRNLRQRYFSPPEGIKAAPTLNYGWVNNQELSGLVDKQLGQRVKEERVQTLKKIEEILGEEMYAIPMTTNNTNWFGDPHVKNMQTPRDAYNGVIAGQLKYWWFEGGKAP